MAHEQMAIEFAAQRLNVTLTPSQRAVVASLVNQKASLIVGAPGDGKSTAVLAWAATGHRVTVLLLSTEVQLHVWHGQCQKILNGGPNAVVVVSGRATSSRKSTLSASTRIVMMLPEQLYPSKPGFKMLKSLYSVTRLGGVALFNADICVRATARSHPVYCDLHKRLTPFYGVPRVAVSVSNDPSVREAIIRSFFDPATPRDGPQRTLMVRAASKLPQRYDVLQLADDEHRTAAIMNCVASQGGAKGVIIAFRKEEIKPLAQKLAGVGGNRVVELHAGLSDHEFFAAVDRIVNQPQFIDLVLCTPGFSTLIGYESCFTIHTHVPFSVTALAVHSGPANHAATREPRSFVYDCPSDRKSDRRFAGMSGTAEDGSQKRLESAYDEVCDWTHSSTQPEQLAASLLRRLGLCRPVQSASPPAVPPTRRNQGPSPQSRPAPVIDLTGANLTGATVTATVTIIDVTGTLPREVVEIRHDALQQTSVLMRGKASLSPSESRRVTIHSSDVINVDDDIDPSLARVSASPAPAAKRPRLAQLPDENLRESDPDLYQGLMASLGHSGRPA